MEVREKYYFLETVWKYLHSYFAQNSLSKKTELNYHMFVKSIHEFLTYISKPQITLDEIDTVLMDEMLIFLRKRGGLTNAGRCIEICKRTMEFARKRKMIQVNEILDYKTGRDKVKDVIHLEQSELQKFLYPQLTKKEHEIARDIYVFQANTGMSFGDLWSFKVITDKIGSWIKNERCKTHNIYWVPFNAEIKRILEKYNYKLPKTNLVTYNRKLKEIAEDEKIPKNLSSHTARKTFATHKYEQGWSLEAISDMMGITVTILTKHYIRKSRKRLENEVLAMKEPVEMVEEVKLRIV